MAGLKYSRQREAIKQYLMGRTDHPTAEKIYADLREADPKLSLGTVYRNLTLLSELGEVKKISTLIGPDHFDGNTSMHFHYMCRCCHAMSDISVQAMAGLTEEVTQAVNGDVDTVEFVAYGTCDACKAAAGSD